MKKGLILLALLCCFALFATSCKFLNRKLVSNQEKQYPSPVSQPTTEDPQTGDDTPANEDPADEPTEEPGEDPAEEPSEDPADDPNEEPGEEPAGDNTSAEGTQGGTTGGNTPSSGDSNPQTPSGENDSNMNLHDNIDDKKDPGENAIVDAEDLDWN